MIAKKHALDDDFDSSPRNVVTGNNVDYLSYKFDEMDLAASWRVLTKQKLTIVNGLRLENASWRTWAKQRNNLKTVSPETLNWLKDSDVTWLYGPLQMVIENMDQKDRYAQPKKSTTEEMLGLMTFNSKQQQPKKSEEKKTLSGKPLKSALKKVKMTDLLKRSVSELHVNTVSNTGTAAGTAGTNSDSISETNDQLGEFSPEVIASHRQPKLRFNQYVEQFVVIAPPERKKSRLQFSEVLEEEEEEEEEEESDHYEPDHDSDADSIVVMRSRRPSRIRSIKKIEPALLKTSSRSDRGSTSSDSSDDNDNYLDSNPSTSTKHRRRRHRDIMDDDDENWDAESAQSDALVQHILEVSKGKERSHHRDPAADLIPNYPIDKEDDEQQPYPGRSDYEYSFDDDDWDTYSQHVEDDPFSLTANQEYAPIAPQAPVGIYPKKEQEDDSGSNSSLFNSIAHWASSHLWPPNNVNNSNH